MSRNLLPRFRETPTPANIEPLPPGQWSVLQNPPELAKLELPAENGSELRTRIQSIPSPWARLHLFHNALQDPQHPARRLVQNEFLDVLEFLWSQGAAQGAPVMVQRVRLADLRGLAEDAGSRRVEDFAGALVELAPRRGGVSGGETALPTISVIVFDGTPIAASSPYTVLFTAEDAVRVDARGLFRYALGAESRPLSRRPFQFQRYVAQVLLPQLEGIAPEGADEYVNWNAVQQGVTQWLKNELRQCQAGKNERVRDQLSPPQDSGGWQTAAKSLQLEPVSPQRVGGLVLFSRRPEADIDESRWRLRAAVPGGTAPIVVDAPSFDGRFFEGAQPVKLPPDLSRLPRGVLPGLDIRHDWVNPSTDWLTDQIFLLGQPLDPGSVRGLKGYRPSQSAEARFAQPRLALPLRSEFFRFFRPDDVDRLLAVEVLSNGSVSVSLTIPVGTDDAPDEVVVRRVYPETHIVKQYGPELAVWPGFSHASWREYTVFRTDREQFTADYVELRAFAGGQPLTSQGAARRTVLVGAVAFAGAPEVLEFRKMVSGSGDQGAPLGVVLPRFAPAAEPNETRLVVGVDFGTSNTIVSVRQNNDAASEIFSAEKLVLGLTREGAETEDFRAGYFFPHEVRGEPFGTAVVHMGGLPHLDLAREPTAVRVTVPFTGLVRNETQNQVTGDLKWSPERETYFLSAAFLRHVVATVLAESLRRGVKAENVSILFSYPRAFSTSQIASLEEQWREVLQTFHSRGLGGVRIARGADESQSVLRHFFNSSEAGTLGAGDVILDVGGGTTDVAAYGESRILLLDSLLLGGKNLTGPRQQGSGKEALTNPFVQSLVRWAAENDLPGGDRAVLEKYLDDGQVHLAFTYLVRTQWFRSGKASRFWATPEFRSFQALVFYFFAALFHYVGLSFRALPPVAGTDEPRLPDAVTLAGNGSQYLHWLSELRPGSDGDPFRRALGEILRSAAGAAPGRTVRINVSSKPKEEVARGLVARAGNENLEATGNSVGPVIGERITAQLRSEGGTQTLEPVSRLGAGETFTPERLRTLKWLEDETEGDRFHAALVRAAETLVPLGDNWAELPDRYRAVLGPLKGKGLRTATTQKLEYLVNLAGGYRGSLFTLEATVVLERMMDGFFGGRR